MSFLNVASSLRGCTQPLCWRQRALLQISSSFHSAAAPRFNFHLSPSSRPSTIPRRAGERRTPFDGPQRRGAARARAKPRDKPSLAIPDEWKTPGVELPPPSLWWKIFRFPEKRKRKTMLNEETARRLAEYYVPEGSKDKVIIEAFAGAGMLTRALLNLPRERIKKIIVLEDQPSYLEWLQAQFDDRVHIRSDDAFMWSSYTGIEQSGLLDDVEVMDWNDQVHPQLQYIAQIPNNVHGEQLIAQLCRAIPDRKWLFRYGRVPLDMITTLSMWERLSAGPVDYKARCKVSVMTQASVEISVPFSGKELVPAVDHFYYPTARPLGPFSTPKDGASEQLQQPLRLLPLEKPAIKPNSLEFWDYVLRNLFITKATPLSKCISGLGPGAPSLLKKLVDPSSPTEWVDISKSPRMMSLEDWSKVVQAFEDWPFRPENLSISNSFTMDNRRP
ncbi:hypothetical protein D9611_000498 [Ephemerocybe angulata]|uniref:rRNA adenine N(6)-methyltransferase n=1 Tax=Ephemerocybe angulata TaxID=980116 RepID=A0A8H5F786_9AGAR|nr:hypothetical protein D9611_000498 [Tulosesus angulatus]